MKKRCPTCRRVYTGLENYCTRCGDELEREKNRCSAKKNVLCEKTDLDPADRFCPYCGAMTTYALAELDGAW